MIDLLMGEFSKDARHEDIRLLARCQLESRQYVDRSMGFAGVRDRAQLAHLASESLTEAVRDR
jgi:hypothetical protein